MQNKWSILLVLSITLLFTACDSSTTTDNIDVGDTSGSLKIIGKIEYERVQPLTTGDTTRLDFNNITTETAKQITVEAINSAGTTIATATTDDNGDYTLLNIPENTYLKIRAYAKISQENKWDTKVIDNTNGNALYVLEGSLVSTGTQSTRRDLKALASTRQSPPFAILDSMYGAMNKVITADSSVTFPPLNLNWSKDNIASSGSVSDGQIITSHFNGENDIYILGDQQSDTDEYDDHIIIHEWAHYFEAKFSRADSIGGGHGAGDHLDIRLAFGEGWGNAWSAIATDDPIYFDTMGSSGWNMNIETATHDTPGWFSEASIQRILYDLYDNNDDGADQLSLGFKPIYDVLIGSQKTTEAFTSIFSFIKGLKDTKPNDSSLIDNIVTSEEINTITDIYGTNRTNYPNSYTLPLYKELTIGGTIQVCTDNAYGAPYPYNNKLNNHKYVRFTVNSTRDYTIRVEQNNGTSADPDLIIFDTSPFSAIAESSARGTEEKVQNLTAGNYLLDISEANNIHNACFNVTIN